MDEDSSVPVSSTSESQTLLNPPQPAATIGIDGDGSFTSNGLPLIAPLPVLDQSQEIINLAQLDSSNVVNHCIGMVHVEATYSRPISALDELCFVASGGYTGGQLVVDGDRYSDEDTIEVQVYAKATESSLLEGSRICLRRTKTKDSRSAFATEIELTTPSRRDDERAKQCLEFTIVLTLPRSCTALRSLAVHAPRFLLDMTERLRSITFGSIDIHSQDAPIYTAELVSAGSISLVTTNALVRSTGLVEGETINVSTSHGQIEGKWLASNKIVTKTLDGGVSGSYAMHDKGLLVVQTTNGKIAIEVSLLPSSDKSMATKVESYKVSVESTNGPVDLNFTEQPKDSYLACEARTTNALAEVKLDPQFQGRFLAQSETAKGRAKLFGPITTTNPISGSTERNIELKPEPPSPCSKVEGTARWGDAVDIENKGTVTISTSNGDVGVILM